MGALCAPWYQIAPLMETRSSGETIAFQSRVSLPLHSAIGPHGAAELVSPPGSTSCCGGCCQGLPSPPDTCCRRDGARAKNCSECGQEGAANPEEMWPGAV